MPTLKIPFLADGAALATVAAPLPGPLVVMDEQARSDSLYGAIAARLGVEPVYANGQSVEQIMDRKPAAILLSSEWTTPMRLMAAAARKANIPVIYVVDGSIEWSYMWNNLSWIRPAGTNLQPLVGSDLCVFGQHQARVFASMGMASRIHVIGLPRLDKISRERIVTPGAKPRIVVATSRTAGHDVEQLTMVLRALRDLQAWAATRKDFDVVWRIAGDLAEDIGVDHDVEGNLSDVLARATALISLPSTCLLEGMHKGIPVAQLEYRPVPLYTATAWEIRSAAHIPTVVHELLYPPPSKLAWQDACFADELEPGDATGRLAEVIRAAIARTENYPRSDQPVRVHGKLDYRQVYSELSAFAMDDIAVLQYELSAAYSTLKKAKLEKAKFRTECVDLAEALAGCDIRHMRHYSFLDRLSACVSRTEPPGDVTETSCTISGKKSRVLLMQPPAKATYVVPTGAAGNLSFAITLHPDVWENPQSGPCRFMIEADDAMLFDVTLDQLADPKDRKWWWFQVTVPEAANGAQRFTFSTQGIGSDAYRWALWRNPTFLWVEADENVKDGFIPQIAGNNRLYAPGYTLA